MAGGETSATDTSRVGMSSSTVDRRLTCRSGATRPFGVFSALNETHSKLVDADVRPQAFHRLRRRIPLHPERLAKS